MSKLKTELRFLLSGLPQAWVYFKWSFDISVFYVYLGPVYIAYGFLVWIGTGFASPEILKNGFNSFTGFLSDHSMARRIGAIMGYVLLMATFSCFTNDPNIPPASLLMQMWAVLWLVATLAPLYLGDGEVVEEGDAAMIAAKLKSERLAGIAASKNVASLASGGDLTTAPVVAGVLELTEGIFYGAKVRPITEANSKSLVDLGVKCIIINKDGIILLSTLEDGGDALKAAERLKQARDRHLYQALADQMGWSGGPRVAGWVIHRGVKAVPKLEGFGAKFTSVDDLIKAFKGSCDKHRAELEAASDSADRFDRS